MGYVNFKEEVYVANQQLNNRKFNNKKIFQQIQKDRTLLKNYSPYQEFSYKIFNNEQFGKSGIEDEDNFIRIENKDILCSKFISCSFNNVLFKNCNFIGCVFEECDFVLGGVSFDGCRFIMEDSIKKPSLNVRDNFSCRFQRCSIYPKFKNCNLSFCIFEDCFIKDASFEKTDMTSIIIYSTDIKMANIQDCDMSGIKFVNSYIEDMEFRDKQKTKLDEKSFFDKIPIRYKNRDEYEGIYMQYETIADKFKENTLDNNFGEYYYLAKCTQRKTLDPVPKIQSYIYWFTCGYGERPLNAVITSLCIIFIFSFIYLFSGLDIDGQIISYITGDMRGLSFRDFITHYNESLTLSISMYGAVGFINAQPAPVSYLISGIEVIIGIIMIGVGIGTLTRKIVR
ncbi:MAG: pentapeptide repeat-containing protein [Clostridium sp.]